MARYNTLGLFGGTFDPIHFGHLRSALEILQALQLDELRIIPCQHPPHRSSPKASPEQRLEMARRGVLGSELKVDDIEMHRSGPSYSIDTLMSLRKDYPNTSLCMIVGIDAFIGLPSWYQWEKLIQLANIVVMCRSGYSLPTQGIIADLMTEYALLTEGSLAHHLAGRIQFQTISTLEISATRIREMVATDLSPRFLLPEKVLEYIQENKLYAHNNSPTSDPAEEVSSL